MDDEPRNESEMEYFTSNTAKERSKELTNHGQPQQPSSHKGKDLSSKVLSKASVIAEANFETDTNTLNVTLEDCSLILVGQPNKAEIVKCNHCCDQDRLQRENCPKEPDSDDRSEREKGGRKKVECYPQVFSKGEIRSDSGPMVADCVERPMEPIQVQGDLSGKPNLSELFLETLEFLQDNGKFDEHDSLITKAKHYYEERQNADMLLLLEIEQAAPLSYKGHSKLATKRLKSVIKSDLKSQTLHPDVITGKAYFLLAADMRRDKNRRNLKFSRILECLRVSECLLINYDTPENLSELYQTYGSVWLDRMSQISNDERNARARKDAGEQSKYYFAKAIYFSKQDDRERVQMKRQKYAHYKLATIHLDSCSPFALAQEKPISPSEIKEAEKHLDIIFDLDGSIPKATLMLIYKTQSDIYNRLGQYQLAIERAEDAYQIACDQEFKTEFEPLQKRIDFLEQKLQTPDHIVNEVHDQSSSDTGYRTSGDDSQ